MKFLSMNTYKINHRLDPKVSFTGCSKDTFHNNFKKCGDSIIESNS